MSGKGEPDAFMNRARLEEARLLVANEFSGLDEHAQYLNAFARLLKPDPLGRVTMLGTDQRDQLSPVVCAALAAGPQRPLRMLDVGCGDGATFQLFAEAAPPGSHIDLLDPNADYVAAYAARLAETPNVEPGIAWVADFVPDPDDNRYTPPLGRDYDLIFCVHSLYFFDDLALSLQDLYGRLAVGGRMILVFADENVGYTGVCLRVYLSEYGADQVESHIRICSQRQDLLEGGALGEPTINNVISGARTESCRQETRLYGHTLADMIALSNISGLSAYVDIGKFNAAHSILANQPESVDFRIESDPTLPRFGMLSVRQPQVICTITRLE